MGKFRAARKVYTLQFEGEYAGLEIKAHGITMGQLLAMGDQPDRLEAGAGLAQVHELIELFVSKVKSWNLQHETLDDQYEDTPIQLDGFLMHDPALVKRTILAWIKAIIDVEDELGKGSASGNTFPEESIPMAVSSPSPAN